MKKKSTKEEFAEAKALGKLRRIKAKVEEHQKKHHKVVKAVDADVDRTTRLSKTKEGRAKLKKERASAKPIEFTNIETPKTKPHKTYREIKRKEVDGWPVHVMMRSDGKKVRISHAKFLKLSKRGVILEYLPPPLPKKLYTAMPPAGAYAIQTKAGDHVQIIYGLGDNWQDLMCYHHRLQTTIHIQRQDLHPKQTVTAVVEFLKGLESK